MTLPISSPWWDTGTQIASVARAREPGPLPNSWRHDSTGSTTVFGLGTCWAKVDSRSGGRRTSWRTPASSTTEWYQPSRSRTWRLITSYPKRGCTPRYSTWTRSASVTQLPSSWTRALAVGTGPLRSPVGAVGLAIGRVAPAGVACGHERRRAGVAIRTEILRLGHDAFHTPQANRAHPRGSAGVDGSSRRRRARLARDPRDRPEDAWLQSFDGRGRRPGADPRAGGQARGRDHRPDAPRADGWLG